jgi:cytoskeleton protein RodZ
MGDFGAKLRQARERRGVSLRQIAAATKISFGVLEALERNDISKLPGGIFSRAFVRSYASEVGLDPDETIRDFVAEFPGEAGAAPHPPSAPAPRAALEPARRAHPEDEAASEESEFESQQRMASVVLRLLIVSIPIALVILYFSMRGGAPAPAPGVEAAPPSRPPDRDLAPPPAAAQAPAPPPPSSPAISKPGPTAAAPAVRLAQRSAGEDTEGRQTIELRPSGPCWVSLTVDGAPSFTREMQAGEREVRTFREEAVLKVGDGAACEFALNGRVARLLGGQGETRTIKITRQNIASYLP